MQGPREIQSWMDRFKELLKKGSTLPSTNVGNLPVISCNLPVHTTLQCIITIVDKLKQKEIVIVVDQNIIHAKAQDICL